MERRSYQAKHLLNAESIIIANYIKYETLGEMTNLAFANSDATSVNIYIDLYQIFRKMYRNDIAVGDRSSVAATIVNLCSHYRAFYKKYYGVYARIFIIQTSGPMTRSEHFYPEYNHTNTEKMVLAEMITTFMLQNCAILKELCKYIPDVYYIQAPFETATIIYTQIQDQYAKGNYDPNIILSTSQLQFIIPALTQTQTIVFKHRWVNSMINYTIIDQMNGMMEYLRSLKLSDRTIDSASIISPKMLGLFMALTRYMSRDLHSILNVSSTVKLLVKLIAEGQLPNTYISDKELLRSILSTSISEDEFELIWNRYRAIDAVYQSELYKQSEYYADKSWDVNLQDPDMVKLLNEKYFRSNPLDLDRL
jgi:hypothetical protein